MDHEPRIARPLAAQERRDGVPAGDEARHGSPRRHDGPPRRARGRLLLRLVLGGGVVGLVAYPAAVSAFAGSAGDPVATVVALDEVAGSRWSPDSLQINPGESVQWSYALATQIHELYVGGVNYTSPEPKDPGDPPDVVTFPQAGTYPFFCPRHSNMDGTVQVGPASTTTPIPTPTVSATPTPTAAPVATPTPAPSPSGVLPPVAEDEDLIAPQLRDPRMRVEGHRLVVRVRLTEAARLQLKAVPRGGGRTKRISTRRAAGRVQLALRLTPGRWKVSLRATDDAGNRSDAVTRSVRVER